MFRQPTDRTATRPMVNQYQMLFFMDRTNILTTWLGGYDSGPILHFRS